MCEHVLTGAASKNVYVELHLFGPEHHELADDIPPCPAEPAVGLLVRHIAGDDLYLPRELFLADATVEDLHLVTRLHCEFHAGQRDLPGSADERTSNAMIVAPSRSNSDDGTWRRMQPVVRWDAVTRPAPEP